MKGLDDLLVAAVGLEGLFSERRWQFCFIGGVAVQRWGNPRFTQDLDLTLLTGFGREEEFLSAILSIFAPRRPDAFEFALRNRVLLARTASGIDVDIALGALPFEIRSIARASAWPLPNDGKITTCSAEDLVIHKVFAGRGRDWDDVETVIARRLANLNWKVIRDELPPLLELKEEPESLERLEQVKSKIERRLSGNIPG